MSESTNYDPPKKTIGDHAHMLSRGVLGMIPVFGQSAIELLELVIAPPLRKRQGEWMNDIAEGLRKLEEKNQCTVDELKDNDTFIDTIVQASQAAMRTARQEKREALCNAVLNSALPNPLDDVMSQMFIGFVDTFSVLHLQLLAFLDDPKAWYEKHGRTPPTSSKTLWPLVLNAFPDLASREVLCEQICRQLHENGLLITSSFRKNVSQFPFFPKKPREEQIGYTFTDELPAEGAATHSGNPTSIREWSTELGRQFLAFITTPPSSKETG